MTNSTHSLNPARRELLEMFALDVEMTRGSGFSLWDAEGQEYLDFLSQYGALPFGHNPPEIWNEINIAQRDGVPIMLQPLRSLDAERLAARLAEITPGDLLITTLTNSGAETVEAAIKLARMRTGRSEILSTVNGFHGKTLGALSATGKAIYQDGFGAPVEGFWSIPYGDLEALRAAFVAGNGKIAAFIVEPIQGEGGVVCPSEGYIDGVIALCREFGILSILDEIQTGLGRTGALFACSGGAEVPDMLLLSKALGGGMMPIGACIVRPSAWDDRFGRLHSSTFAGNGLACRAALATLELLTRDNQSMVRSVAENGLYLRARLEALQAAYPSVIREVRGRGYMLGLEFHRLDKQPNSALMAFASINGGITPLISSYLLNIHQVLTAPLFNDTHVIRLQPPLIAGRAEIDRAIAALGQLCDVLASKDYYRLVRHLVAKPLAERARPPQEAVEAIGARSTAAVPGHFAFLIHYTEEEDIFRSDPSLRQFNADELANWCEWVKQFGPGFARRIPAVASKTGATAEGWIMSVPMLPTDMRGNGRKVAAQMIQDAVDMASRDGASRVGLGAFTSIVTRGGDMVTGRGMPITSGNTLTTVSAIKGIETMARMSGIDIRDAHVVVVGASGAIGRLASLMLARRAGRLTLVGNAANPFSPRLLSRVADEVCEMLTSVPGEVSILPGALRQRVSTAVRRFNSNDENCKGLGERVRMVWRGYGQKCPLDWNVALDDALEDADIVLVATSSEVALINPDRLKPGTLVCDVARPRNVANATKGLGEVLVFDGGLIKPPFEINLGPFQTLPGNLCWGCLGETLLLSLAGETNDYSIGSQLPLTDADHIAALAEIHGFEPPPAQWDGRDLSDTEIARFAACVADRQSETAMKIQAAKQKPA
ncbi:MAG: aminotransferase class III-fold pyridoxal phosphate-dependent enzyme [Cypionkella sp.]|uniref:aminotransferase class III-fold pyridoxal phosphate-dependent enzyme n=1 Tax=Cypionkella sp. TaxID=2811411 RepID=UPI00261B6126|nr:aminotransferase class III-fold pyridoxal phosphate-dependent enzyme [Cypionkella sp.]MDB5661566.1 aminotransferase class III-fold pyridoxal phosphate-dependent enzyme [Cypionkella sp.]